VEGLVAVVLEGGCTEAAAFALVEEAEDEKDDGEDYDDVEVVVPCVTGGRIVWGWCGGGCGGRW
jgi:hypothetical protein